MLIIISAFPLIAPVQAEASGNLWQNIVNFAKSRLPQGKTIVIDNAAASMNKDAEDSKNKKNNEQKNIKNKKDVPDDNITLDEIEESAEFASQAVGVNKDYLMGMLVVESALGQNTGQCTYEEVEDGAEQAHQNGRLSFAAWETFQERKRIIHDIADSLGYDASKLKISCNPPYAGTGGAMGVEQFMPDTWLEYKDRVAAVVGKENPDPWSVRDGVVAMALKVADVPGVVEHNVWAERNASKLYLSGTVSWQYEWYANEAQYWAKNYQKLLT